ncbi:CaiB/BaiF CoA transferase family protein [Roseibium aggregatum]|uniref:CoA transferase n=1 Tax=Roseibium aggregatum TaxID=187304 RepID=A0A926S5E5_9HYPH|nr:CoA transferase [Roseibium aggregatum]MBD1546396.1 CoA transferase [Roseibium aggregatum]
MPQPLEGLTVLDFTTLLPGPLATLMLAEAGARVIKVERPGGEDMRRFAPFAGGVSVLFAQLNRGKEVVELDLKAPDVLTHLEPLLAGADILVEQFRPGVMERLGLGYETLSARFPGLIYCSISGYGQAGPNSEMAGHDLNYQALTGLLAQSCGSLEHPSLPPTQIADIGGGSFPAMINILLAVLQRQKTGRGTWLDIAMSDAMFTFGLFAHAFHAAGKTVPEFGSALLTGGSPRYRLYPAADGKMIAVGALEEKFWQRLCALLDIPEELRDDRKAPERTASAIASAFATREAGDWEDDLIKADCCACLVKTFEEARNDPHFEERGLFGFHAHAGAVEVDASVVPIVPEFRKP